MITIDLEKQLIKENKRLASPRELLSMNEYDKHAGLVDNDILSRIGLNDKVKEGKAVKDRISEKQIQTQKYNKDRVFHISQIKAICEKYHLRFLEAKYYKGVIDDQLPEKITTFEVAYQEKCTRETTFIVAPKNSFELEQKPKDPLMFYMINDEYYYLIHKWGNDLNLFRRLFPYLAKSFFSMLIIAFIFTLPVLLIPIVGFIIYCSLAGCVILILTILNSVEGWDNSDEFNRSVRLIDRNEWNSKHEYY